MSQDVHTGFGSYYMPIGFGSFDATSTAVDGFGNTMEVNMSPLEQRTFRTPSSFDSDTPLDISTDESMSPRSHTSSMFDIHDLMPTSSIVPDMNPFYDFFDSRAASMPNPLLSVAPITPDLDYFDDNSQAYVPKRNFPWTYRHTNRC